MPLTRFAGRIGRLPTQFFVQLVKKTEDMISAGLFLPPAVFF